MLVVHWARIATALAEGYTLVKVTPDTRTLGLGAWRGFRIKRSSLHFLLEFKGIGNGGLASGVLVSWLGMAETVDVRHLNRGSHGERMP